MQKRENIFYKIFGGKFQIFWVTLLAIILAFVIGAIAIIANRQNPYFAYIALFRGAFGSINKIATVLTRTTILIFTGLAVAIAFRSGIFIIGAEGQLYLGAFASALVGIYLTNIPKIIHIPLAILAAMLVGGFWSFIPAILKVRYKMDEVVVSLMMNAPAILIVGYLVNEPFRDPIGQTGMTVLIQESSRFNKLVEFSKFNSTFFIALFVALLMIYLMQRSTVGYEWKITGLNPIFSRFGGVYSKRRMLQAAIISGMLAGMAGSTLVLGEFYRCLDIISAGYGWDGLLVAMIVNNNPIGVILVAFLFGVLKTGALAMEAATNIPSELSLVIQSIIILFVAAERGVLALIQRKGEVPPIV